MKVILLPGETADRICGKQRVLPNTQYRETKHLLRVPCEEGMLLFHTLTGELLLMERGDDPKENSKALIERWFLVPDTFDECSQSDTVYRIAAILNPVPENKTKFTVLTTTDCNARCFYCYERGIPRFSMSPAVAKDVALYIARECAGAPVSLSWFGGEPLYNLEAIDLICACLREHDVEYSSILTSNGFFLDEATAKKAAADWKVHSAQIAVDGTEKVYNRTKAFLDTQESPFRRVLDNIEHALDAGIHISIRLNMDRENAEDLYRLIDLLGDRYGRLPNLSAHVIVLKGITGKVHEFRSPDDALEWKRRLERKLDEWGYLKYGSLPRGLQINRCMADNPACEVILPDGRIQRCEHFDEAEIVGSIYESKRDERKCREWTETVRFPGCANCALYPMCVPLRRCPWNAAGCSASRQADLFAMYSRVIRSTYEREKSRED